MTSAESQPPQDGSTLDPASVEPLVAKCHCGRVQITLPSKPPKLNECQCTVCYKYGALWGYFTRGALKVNIAPDAQLNSYQRYDEYCQGDLSFNRCSHCGCMTHWWGENEYTGPEHKMGVNCRLLTPEEIADIPRKMNPGPTE